MGLLQGLAEALVLDGRPKEAAEYLLEQLKLAEVGSGVDAVSLELLLGRVRCQTNSTSYLCMSCSMVWSICDTSLSGTWIVFVSNACILYQGSYTAQQVASFLHMLEGGCFPPDCAKVQCTHQEEVAH